MALVSAATVEPFSHRMDSMMAVRMSALEEDLWLGLSGWLRDWLGDCKVAPLAGEVFGRGIPR
jgi:hypothetical protein